MILNQVCERYEISNGFDFFYIPDVKECAVEMVAGALAKTPAAMLALAITGIAGPGGATPDKPIGLVHFALQRRGEAAQLDRVIFTGDRSAVRAQATLHALQLLAKLLADGTQVRR